MKVLFTSIFTFLIFVTAFAFPFDEIKVGTNAITSSIELRFTSTCAKKNAEAIVYVLNEKGLVVKTFKASINKGENIIPLADALSLREGLYTVNILINKKTLSTKLMIFE
jgi:hypothetical protein